MYVLKADMKQCAATITDAETIAHHLDIAGDVVSLVRTQYEKKLTVSDSKARAPTAMGKSSEIA